MTDKRKGQLSKVLCIALIVLITLGTAGTAEAAVNKSLKIGRALFKKVETVGRQYALRGAELCAAFPKNDKLKKKGMTFSATVYIPTKALNYAGDMVSIDGYLYLQGTKAGNNNKKQQASREWPYFRGFIETKYYFTIRLNKKKEPVLIKRDWNTNKETKAGKYMSVVKKKSYYMVRLMNVPLTTYFDKDNRQRPVITTSSFLLSLSIIVLGDTKKSWRGNIYVDDLRVKTAKRTQTITFDKKDYRGLYVSNWANSSDGQGPVIAKPMK